jgi:hypothetical protein
VALLQLLDKANYDECVELEKKYNVLFERKDDQIRITFSLIPPPVDKESGVAALRVLKEHPAFVTRAHICIVDATTMQVVAIMRGK